MAEINKKILKRSLWSAIAKLISVMLGAGAGSLLYRIIGGGFSGISTALALAVISFLLLWFVEYEKEVQ